jgi:hypothetical protein
VAEAVDIPVVVQDFPPAVGGITMSVELIARLAAASPRLSFLKLEDDPAPMKITQIRAISREVKIFGGLGGMMFLEELVAVVAGEEASGLTGKAGEPGYTQPVERERERPQDRNPVAGGCLPRRDAGEGSDSCINLGVKVEEGGKVDVELRNTSKVPDASGDAVAEKREGGPTGKAKDGRDRAGGLGGDGGGLALAIRTSAGGASKNDAAIALDGERG